MESNEPIRLRRACDVTQIPSGIRSMLPAGTVVRITQSFGGAYTVQTDYGYLLRIDAKDADALGITETAAPAGAPASEPASFSEPMMWEQLRTVYDPEIPVNVVDLGLIYSCEIKPLEDGSRRIEVKMSMTAPGCGMADILKADVHSKLAHLPTVKEVQVDVVFDPPWHPGMMSEAARLKLGLDLDPSDSLPTYGEGSSRSY